MQSQVVLIVTLICTTVLLCDAQQSGGQEIWQVKVVVGVQSPDSLFHLTDQPVIVSPSRDFYLAVQAAPANNPLNPGDEFFCWLAVVNQTLPDNKTLTWRAPCDRELQRSNDSLQMCYFGVSAQGSLELSHAFPGRPIAFSSNTSNQGVDHAIVDDSGVVILQTASTVRVWSSEDHPSPGSCLGPLDSFNITRRALAPSSAPPSRTSAPDAATTPPSNASGRTPLWWPTAIILCLLVMPSALSPM